MMPAPQTMGMIGSVTRLRPGNARPVPTPPSLLVYPLHRGRRPFLIAADDRARAHMKAPSEGQIGLVRQKGFWPWCIRWATHSDVDHSIVYIGGRMVVSAAPHGAVVRPLDDYPDVVWSHFTSGDPDHFNISNYRKTIHWAFEHVDTPYNLIDDAVLAAVWILGKLTRVDVPSRIIPRSWARRLSDPRHLQCAQLCDLALQAGGIHVFPDHRLPSDVTPADFEKYYHERGWWPRERGRHRARRNPDPE